MKYRFLIPLVALIIAVFGCGGGGASGPTAFGAIFFTDSLDTHDHVWVTVQKVVLAGAEGPVTVFDDAAGMTLDLAALRDATGERYKFFGTIPAGVYTGVTVTVAKDLVLFEAGSPTGLAREFAGNNGTTADLVLTFDGPTEIGPNNPFGVDFDLGNWDDDGTTVTGNPFLQESGCNGIDDMERHEHDDIGGVIEGLSGAAPDQTFTLVTESGNVPVMTNGDTVLSDLEALANAMRVEVKGTFSTLDNAFIAESIKPADDNDWPEAEGTAFEIAADPGTFDLMIDEADHFVPSLDSVHVVTDGQTVFTDANGNVVAAADFFAALEVDTELEVRGSYNADTNTLTAYRVSYEEEVIEGGGA